MYGSRTVKSSTVTTQYDSITTSNDAESSIFQNLSGSEIVSPGDVVQGFRGWYEDKQCGGKLMDSTDGRT